MVSNRCPNFSIFLFISFYFIFFFCFPIFFKFFFRRKLFTVSPCVSRFICVTVGDRRLSPRLLFQSIGNWFEKCVKQGFETTKKKEKKNSKRYSPSLNKENCQTELGGLECWTDRWRDTCAEGRIIDHFTRRLSPPVRINDSIDEQVSVD